MKTLITNDYIMEILNKRDEAFQDIYNLQTYDDNELEKIDTFKNKYNNLKQWEQDLYYVYLQVGSSKTAELYGICYSTCFKKIKRIKDKLK